MDEEAPRTIGRYEVLGALGEGGMAQVWRARDPALGREVAIKVVKVDGLPQSLRDTFVERFKNEARAVAMLKHSSIVAVHDTGVDEGLGVYSVYELVKGASLREKLDRARGPLPREECVRIVRAVGEALQAAHDAGIVHRDVKPGNILIADDGTVKLADFGVARLPDASMTREGTFLGTPSYAAPEALKKGAFGPASDIWAFGVVAYETICGRHPFAGDDVDAVSNLVLHGTITPPVELRPEIGRLASDTILLALERDVDKRAPSAGALARTLARALESAGPDGARPGAMRRAIGLVAVAVAIVAGAFAVRAVTESEGASIEEDTDGGAPGDDPGGGREGPAKPPPRVPPPPATRDAGAAAPPDAAATPPRPLDPRSEEDRIKDLLAQARRLRGEGDIAGARRAVEEVLRLDAAHPEARALQQELGGP